MSNNKHLSVEQFFKDNNFSFQLYLARCLRKNIIEITRDYQRNPIEVQREFKNKVPPNVLISSLVSGLFVWSGEVAPGILWQDVDRLWREYIDYTNYGVWRSEDVPNNLVEVFEVDVLSRKNPVVLDIDELKEYTPDDI